MVRIVPTGVFAVLLAVLTAFPTGQAASAAEPLVVYTVNYPLQYFAWRIGGERVRAVFPVPAGGDPAYWRPDPEDVARFRGADLVLTNGAGYAGWLKYAALPLRTQVNTSAGFRTRYIREQGGTVHRHGPGGEHAHGSVAFTTWLDFALAADQAAAVERALARVRPGHAAEFADRRESLEKDLLALDRRMRAVGKALARRQLIYSHPVYQYMERAYGLEGTSLHWEPDTEPEEGEWQALRQAVEGMAEPLMIWEAPPLASVERRLQGMGVRTVVFEPLGGTPGEGDFLSVMEANVARLEQAVGAGIPAMRGSAGFAGLR